MKILMQFHAIFTLFTRIWLNLVVTNELISIEKKKRYKREYVIIVLEIWIGLSWGKNVYFASRK